MYQNILVPLDGTLFSERALPLAVMLARATGAKLTLVRAAWSPDRPGLDPMASQMWAVREARTYLDTLAQPLLAQGLTVETAVPFALADAGILREIEIKHADLVVMTSHRKETAQHKIYGSVAAAVLSGSRVPVLVIRMDETMVPPPVKPAAPGPHLLVTLDGSSFAEAVLPYAAELARALQWTIVLLRVLAEPVHPDAYLESENEALSYLVSVAAPLRKMGLTVRTEIKTGSAPAVILNEAEALDVGLVAMATHGETAVRDMLFGSVAMEVLRHTPTPLLLIRPANLPSRHPTWEDMVSQLDTQPAHEEMESFGEMVPSH